MLWWGSSTNNCDVAPGDCNLAAIAAGARQLAPRQGSGGAARDRHPVVMAVTLSFAGLACAAVPAMAMDAAALNAEAHALERTDPAAALDLATRAAALAGNADHAAAAEAALHRSHALRLLGRHGEALSAGEAARQQAEATGDDRTAARAAAALAVLYETGGLDAEALALHRHALRMFEQQGWKEATASTLINLGNLLERRGELADAAAAFRRALDIKRDNDAPGKGAALASLATVAFSRQRFGEAEQLLREAIATQQQEQDLPGEAVSWRNLAGTLQEVGRSDEARDALAEAARLAARSGNVLVRAAVAEGRAELLEAAARNSRSRLREALGANAEALRLAADAEPSRQARLQRQRARLAERLGDPATALAALRQAEAFEDKERRAEHDRRYAVLASYFDSEKQRLNIAALSDRAAADAAEMARQRVVRNSLVAGSALLAAIALLLYARIRQRRRAEHDLAAHNRRLEAALATADRERANAQEAERVNRELLRVAADDLRLPLTSALGNAERLLMLGADQPALRRDAAAIADTLQHLVHLVTDLVESAELERQDARLEREPLDLAQVLRGVCAHYGLRASEKRQQLECHAPAELRVEGDAARLREALEHLVGNALKFTPSGKRIDALLEAREGHAVVRVRDQGPGLREQDRERAFGKLQRVGNRPTGNEHSAGLGLWLVRRIAELHGGDIRVQPAPDGEGSEFVLRIPLRAD